MKVHFRRTLAHFRPGATWWRSARTAPLLLSSLAIAGASWLAYAADAQTGAQTQRENLPAEQIFENIQVLKGMRAADLQGAMSFIASSLGVDCDYCHRQDFGGDTVPAKLRAREMILMVRAVNQGTFHNQNVVNCFTCHQGNPKPISIAPIHLPESNRPPEHALVAPAAQTASLLTVNEVLDRYVQALGGQAALDAVKTRVTKTGALSGKNPDNVTEIFQRAPGKVLVAQESPGYTQWVGFNGSQAWAQDSEKSYWGLLNTQQRNSIMRESELYAGSRLRTEYTNVKVEGKDKSGERDVYVIAGTSSEGTHEKFYFDTGTGLLLRRHIEEQTILGWLQVQADFDDYRAVDGIQIPFIVQWHSAGGAWGTRTSSKILEIHQNVAIDDEKFEHPPAVKSPSK